MKLRITGASGLGYWYRTRIGDVFEVVSVCSGIQKYEVRIEGVNTGYVDFTDGEEYRETDIPNLMIIESPDSHRQMV